MRTFRTLAGVPLGMCVLFLFLRRFDWGGDAGTILFVLGTLASGCVAGALAGWRAGLGAAALFVVFVYAFIFSALLLAAPGAYSLDQRGQLGSGSLEP